MPYAIFTHNVNKQELQHSEINKEENSINLENKHHSERLCLRSTHLTLYNTQRKIVQESTLLQRKILLSGII